MNILSEHDIKGAIPSREEIEGKIAKWSEVVQVEREEKKKKYDATCSNCGAKTKVSFKPDGVRPVYCSNCLQKLRETTSTAVKVAAKEGAVVAKAVEEQEQKEISLEEAAKQEPQSFKKKRKEIDVDDLRASIKEAIDDKE